ncbi:inositol monophosphatase/fructose-1,6-bisphosphatase family protein [Actinoalloteichus sp. GBA129-24]|uniref:Inositol monophosphatase/fructose-1,6-bisphosphatase family protein n=2 Tax=Pseudonocardiaceae TaxID=2070 RepID=A0AAC9L865_9PSEU|nr:inositol monophosphatase/fructose-1,6-bisphosphatase family protein [Actinoalloteichus fjordicus]APU18549.1 inositol monophosphatase/fructose-1,6-bisphosphatase family protein [Actinoalloteichus sp. GBA129-24]
MPSVSGQPMDPGLLSRALEIAGRLAGDAADVIIAKAGRGARPAARDSPFDWVTDTHRTLERHTRRVLAEHFPDIPLFGADAGPTPAPAVDLGARSGPVSLRWLVSAVDGNANFVAGVPWCAYSLAMLDATGPLVGAVADPFRGQVYAGARGRGMRANGTPVTLGGGRTSTAGAVVCTELTRTGLWPGMVEFTRLAAQAHAGVRVLGCSALAITQVALGQVSAAVLHGCPERDVAGALALAGEAGAVISWPASADDRTGGPLGPDVLLVAAPGVAAEVSEWWRCATL